MVYHSGRIIVVPNKKLGIPSNHCLTSVATGEANHLDLKVAECGSDVKPPKSQQWNLEQNDFGHVITFVSFASVGP
jgi:hypothetical protein